MPILAEKPLNTLTAVPTTKKPRFKLRPYQKTLVKDAQSALAEHRKVVLQLDTAGGKSVILSELLRLFGGKQFVVAHRIELLNQIKEHLSQWMPAEQIAVVAGGLVFDLNTSVFLISVSSFESFADFLPAPTLIAIDECHHATAASYQALFGRYPEAKILGLTATPERLDGTPLNTVFDALVCGPLTSELHDQGYTADYDYYAPEWRLKDKGCRVKNEFSGAKIAAANKASTVAPEVFKAYKDLLYGKRTLIFAQTVEHSQEIAAEFTRQGLRCWHLDGETPADRRVAGMAALRAGELDAITSVNLFDEGIDIPGLEGVLIARRTASITKYLQMCGRIKRLSPEATIKRIVDCTDNWIEHGLPSFDREWSISQTVKLPGTGKMRRNPKTGEVDAGDDELPDFEVVYREVSKTIRVDTSPFRPLYDQGLVDREIADKCGCNKSTVCAWRKKNGLPSNRYRVARQFRALYDQGLNDRQIAEKVECSFQFVARWRNANGLKHNRYQVCKSQFRTLYDQGLTDSEIAERVECSFQVVAKWRRENGLPCITVAKAHTIKFHPLYNQGLIDREIAKQCGYSTQTVFKWRKKHNLPPNNHNKHPKS